MLWTGWSPIPRRRSAISLAELGSVDARRHCALLRPIPGSVGHGAAGAFFGDQMLKRVKLMFLHFATKTMSAITAMVMRPIVRRLRDV